MKQKKPYPYYTYVIALFLFSHLAAATATKEALPLTEDVDFTVPDISTDFLEDFEKTNAAASTSSSLPKNSTTKIAPSVNTPSTLNNPLEETPSFQDTSSLDDIPSIEEPTLDISSPDEQDLFSEKDLSEISAPDATPGPEGSIGDDLLMETDFSIPLPHLGTITLHGAANLATGYFSLSKTLPAQRLGPLELGELAVSLSSKKGLSAFTKVSLYDHALNLSLDHLQSQESGLEARFTLSFDSEVAVPLTPWKTIPLTKFTLRLTQNVKELSTKTTLNEPDDTTFSLNMGQENYALMETKALRLSSLFEFFKERELDKIALEDFKLRIENPFKKNAPHPVEFSALLTMKELDLGIGREFPPLRAKATYSERDGFALHATMPDFSINHVGDIKNPKIIISNRADLLTEYSHSSQKVGQKADEVVDDLPEKENPIQKKAPGKTKPFLTIQGTADINLPLNLGRLPTTISATLQKGRMAFSANIDKVIKVGDMPITQPRIFFSSDGNAEIIGGIVIGGLEAYAHLKIERKDGKEIVTFYGTLKDDKPLKPFENIPEVGSLPGFKDFSINDVKIGLSADKKFFFEGTTTLFGLEMKCKIKKTAAGVAVWAETPPDFKISNIVPHSKGTPLDDLSFQKMWISTSSIEYFDEDYQVEIKQGFNLIANVEMKGASFGGIKQLLKGAPDVLKLQASISKNPKDMIFLINVPMEIKLSSAATLKGIGIEIAGQPPKIGGVAKLHVTPTSSELLIFDAKIEADPTQVLFSGSMRAMNEKDPNDKLWHNPLGVKGFSIGQVAAEIGALYTMTPPLPIFAVTGELAIGSKKMMMALKISANLSDIILMGKLNELDIQDVIDLANQVGARIPASKIPSIGLKNVNIHIAPKGGKIGTITFDPGFTIKGEMNIDSFKAKVNMNVDETGIIAEALMKKINIGPLSVTRGELNIPLKDNDAEYEGPVARLALNLREQVLYISGKIDLVIFGGSVDILLDKSGYSFTMIENLGGIYRTTLEAKSTGSGSSVDFWMQGKLESTFTDDLEKKVNAAIEAFQKKAAQDINTAEAEVRKLQTTIDDFNQKISARKQTIEALRHEIERKNEAAKEKVRSAQDNLNKAQSAVSSIQREIDSTDREISELKSQVNYQPSSTFNTLDIFTPLTSHSLHLAFNENTLDTPSFAVPLLSPFRSSSLLYSLAMDETKNDTSVSSTKMAIKSGHFAASDLSQELMERELAWYKFEQYETFFEGFYGKPYSYASWWDPRDWGEEIKSAVIDPTVEAAKTAARKAQEVAQAAKRHAEDLARKAKDHAVELAQKAKDHAESVARKAKEHAELAARKAKEAAERAAEEAKKAAKKVELLGKIAALEVKKKGLEAGKGTTQVSLQAAEGTLRVAEKMAFDPTIAEQAARITKEGIEISGLEAAKGAAIASKEAAVGALEGAKYSAQGLGEIGKFVLSGLGKSVVIKRAAIEASLRKLIQGDLPTLDLDASLFGKDINFKLALNFRDIGKGMEDIATHLFNEAKNFAAKGLDRVQSSHRLS